MSALEHGALLAAALFVACAAEPGRPDAPAVTRSVERGEAESRDATTTDASMPESAVEASAVAAADGAQSAQSGEPDAAADVAADAAPPHAPVKLGGPCVAVPNPRKVVTVHSSGINQDGERFENNRELDVERWQLDVDGDGQDDFFVPVGIGAGKCPWQLKWAVYVMRGGCGHRVGEVGPGDLVGEVEVDPSGFRRLEFESRGASAGGGSKGVPTMETRTTRFAFSNGRYRKIDEDVSQGKCHHCATSQCVTR